MKVFTVKPIINKKNGQINISIPKKKIDKIISKDPSKIKDLKIRIEKWSFK